MRRAGKGRGKRERKGKRHVGAGSIEALLAHRELQALRYPNSETAYRKLLDLRLRMEANDA